MFFQNVKKGDNSWFFWGSTMCLIVFGYFIGQFPLYGAVYYMISSREDLDASVIDDFFANPDFAIIGMNANVGLILLILMFVCVVIGLYLGVKYLHKRSFLSLVYHKEKLRLRQLKFGFVYWFFAMIIVEVVSFIFLPATYMFTFDLMNFIPLILISFFLLPIQTSAEELVIRGYLMQGIGYLSNNKIIALITTTLIFGMMHGLNPEIDQYGFWPMMIYYLSAGLFLGIITIMDDGLELALGTHAAINIYGATMVSYEGAAIQTGALFKASDVYPMVMTAGFVIAAIIFVLLAKNRFHWQSFNYLLESPMKESSTN